MKNLILIAAFLVSGVSLSAQGGLFGVYYATGAPLGETQDFISNYSWRGIGFEGHWFLNEQLTAGFTFQWNVFYEKESGSFVDGDRTVTGTQERYLNVFPLLVEGHYYFTDDYAAVRPYVGAGIGTQRSRRRTEMGIFAVDNNKWQFLVSPSAGVMIPFGGGTNLNLGVKYFYALKAGDFPATSFLGVNLGFAWENY